MELPLLCLKDLFGASKSAVTQKKGRLQHGFLMEGISYFESCILTIE
jgi:hypothetical protein